MYESVVFQGEAQVIQRDEKGNVLVICKIPNYYSNNEAISNFISDMLNRNSSKYTIKPQI